MKLIQAIKQYCIDSYHDFIVKEAAKYGIRAQEKHRYPSDKNWNWGQTTYWKEGNLFYYIKQQYLSNKKNVG